MPANDDILATRKPVGPLGLISLKSCEELGDKVDCYLVKWRKNRKSDHLDFVEQNNYKSDTYKISVSCPRFGSGEAKGVIKESVRGYDLYLMVDVTNYSLAYSVSGHENHMSPDDH